MSTATTTTAPTFGTHRVLADLLGADVRRSAVLITAGALLTAAASQLSIPLGYTPVPINLATFAAALTGGALGARRGAASMGLFLVLGIVGFPFFADASSGWSTVTGATGGYLLAYPIMAAIVGLAAQRGRDRNVVSFVLAVVAANVILYAIGAAWLAQVLGVPMFGGEGSAFALGVQPFLAGDAAKMLAAGLLFPTAWRLIGE